MNALPDSQVRVHLVDADCFSRKGVAAQLNETNDLLVEDCFFSLEEYLKHRGIVPPDVLLISLPDSDPMSDRYLREVVSNFSETKIALLTINPTMQVLDDAYDSGIAGVISKHMIGVELPNYIRAIAEGYWVFIRPLSGGPCAKNPLREGLYKAYLRSLNPRDQAIVQRVALGMTNSQIARETFMSEGAIKKRLLDIFTDLGITKRVHLTLFACDAGTIRAKDLVKSLPESLRLGS